MATITEALVVEHRALTALLDQIERDLSREATLAEVRLIARLLEGCLRRHAGAEEGLALVTLDHVLDERGRLDRLYEDHEEISVHLLRVHQTEDRELGLRRLRRAITSIRKHFEWEESTVFPLVERTLQGETLQRLCGAFLEQGRQRPVRDQATVSA